LQGLSLPEGVSSVTWENWLTEVKSVDLVWGQTNLGYLTVAPKDNRMGAYVDLGTESQLIKRYHIDDSELVMGSVFLSIHLDNEENIVSQFTSQFLIF
jgi:hypothetical protein